ncbi:MAG: S8 family serine peptidase [Bryobacterales bacterium]|nr:S8 family serine peptidase [Bryobacterales bacterium]
MSSYAAQQIRATGTANVIVVLKPERNVYPTTLEKNFRWTRHHEEIASAGAGDAGLESAPIEPEPPKIRYYPHLGIAYGTVDESGLESLHDEPDHIHQIVSAPPVQPIHPTGSTAPIPTDEITWGIQALNVPALWAQGLSGKGVRIAHLDSGIDGNHPALGEAITGFAEFNPLGHPTRRKKPIDTALHGTHTAGIIAGRKVRNRSIGVAPGALLTGAIVMEGGDLVARLLAGLDWAIAQSAAIVSVSLGIPGYSDDFAAVIQIVREKGILPVFAVGNEGPDTSRSPGNYADVISVGAANKDGGVAPESSSQRFDRAADPLVPDLVMPGVDILSANVGGNYRMDSGTSMAAPHVAGLAALLWEAKPGATIDEIEAAIYKACTRSPAMPEDRANRGMPDAVKALTCLLKPN